jgi:L-histidine N-alpha-methyltransferase
MSRTLTVELLVRPDDRRRALEEDVRRGLEQRPRSIPPVWFYDERGSRLFDEITRLPEYYLTRAEKSILAATADRVARSSGANTLVEIGSGTSEKTRILFDAMAAAGQLESIVLLDISEEVLREAAEELSERYDVDVRAVVGDLRSDLGALAGDRPSLWAFLGSTVGNFAPADRQVLLGQFRAAMGAGDHLLIGTDLQKDPVRLLAAYDDSQGVTAAFNLNVLSVLNAELNADFEPESFEHRAVWNPEGAWIEMRLRSKLAQTVAVKELGLTFDLAEGEEILTEISAKFERRAFTGELRSAGLDPVEGWTDSGGDFLLTLARAV